MRITVIALGLNLLALVTALPSKEHHHSKKPCKSGIAASAGIHVYGSEKGPYKAHNATAAAVNTGLYIPTGAIADEAAAATSSPAADTHAGGGSNSIDGLLNDKAKGEVLPAADTMSAAASTSGSCGAATVTVTVNPTITVTASASSDAAVDVSSAILSSLAPVTAGQSVDVSSTASQSDVPLEQQTSFPPSPLASQSEVPLEQQTSFPPSPLASQSEVPLEQQTSFPPSPLASQSEVPLEQQTSFPPSPLASQSEVPLEQQTSFPSPPSSDRVSHAPNAPATSSSDAAVKVPATTNEGLKTKRGIIASGSDQHALVAAFSSSPKISWLGDWYSAPPSNLPSTISFVPQMYGRQSTKDFPPNAAKAVAAGTKYFLSFGEPGTPNAQLYMDPATAVDLFMQYMQPYAAQGVTIGAPGCLQNTADLAWLAQFLDLCSHKGCSIGFIAMHWFWRADQVKDFQTVVGKYLAVAESKGVKLWVDNFQATGSIQAQMDFLGQVVPWLDGLEGVERYAYVPVGRGPEGMIDDAGNLSQLGSYYAGL